MDVTEKQMTPQEEHIEILRRMTEQHQTLIDMAREATERAETAEAALQTKRDKEFAGNRRAMFAAMAMEGALAVSGHPAMQGQEAKWIARDAVNMADELLAALSGP